jgi:hypothetical protein
LIGIAGNLKKNEKPLTKTSENPSSGQAYWGIFSPESPQAVSIEACSN